MRGSPETRGPHLPNNPRPRKGPETLPNIALLEEGGGGVGELRRGDSWRGEGQGKRFSPVGSGEGAGGGGGERGVREEGVEVVPLSRCVVGA